MNITKSGRAESERPDVARELEAVNAFAKTELGEAEVYIFPVLLCDNEVDRDFERFTDSTLAELRELFVGRTGISDHDWRAGAQQARIYRTELLTGEAANSLGEPYRFLKGWAYMLRTPENAETIAKIEGGILRETSVGCSVAKSLCSVCGEELGSGACSHVKGREYGGKLCFAELTGAVDAYEWSFVAVPAQRNAGVIKRFGGAEGLRGFVSGEGGRAFLAEFTELESCAALGRRYMKELRRELLRLALLWDEGAAEALRGSVEAMDEAQLLSLKTAFEGKLKAKFPPLTQLPGRNDASGFDGEEFII